MSALFYIVAFILGVVAVMASTPKGAPSRGVRRSRRNTKRSQLDTVDDMVLFGEVSNDSFYDIM